MGCSASKAAAMAEVAAFAQGEQQMLQVAKGKDYQRLLSLTASKKGADDKADTESVSSIPLISVWTDAAVPAQVSFKSHTPAEDADALHHALRGKDNDEVVISILCHRTDKQRQEIVLAYQSKYGKSLEELLRSNCSGMYKQLMVALVLDPAERDAAFVHEAVAGLGTDDALLVEVLSCMEGPHLVQVRNAYKRMFASDMASDVLGDTSGHFRRFLEHVLAGQRMPTVVATGSTTKLTPVDSADAKRTAQMLFDAGEGKIFGTDEGIFDKIFTTQSFRQLSAVFEQYRVLGKSDIRVAIEKETSGNYRRALKAVVDFARNPVEYWAHLLHTMTKGAGTADHRLCHALISRADVDLASVAAVFGAKYGQPLAEVLKAETMRGSNYQHALLSLINQAFDYQVPT